MGSLKTFCFGLCATDRGFLKGGNFLVCFLFLVSVAQAQFSLSGVVKDTDSQKPVANTDVFNKTTNQLAQTNGKGEFVLEGLKKGTYSIAIFGVGYNPQNIQVSLSSDTSIVVSLIGFSKELSEVVVSQQEEMSFSLSRLNPVEGTSIFAGKKSEVVLLSQSVGNLAANNARQIYSQVVGLNIYENSDAGLQLNIGGRGLDPNRTANFNTRQNGYDISADVLGYPESYYTPPAEALGQIQVVRGAASLQYGTQFGGLVNFKFKKPNPDKKIEWTSRQSVGSYGLFTSFNSLSGTVGKFSYYTYFNYKEGDGFRPNSNFDSKNFFGAFNYALGESTSISLETTYLKYLAKQSGGMTDSQFEEDPLFSNRERNWFEVDWKLFALKFKHKFSSKTDFSVNLFGLNAERNALGFRGDPKRPERNPITEMDDPEEFTRDLIKGQFNNWGAEARLLTRYNIQKKEAIFLIGAKYYQAQNYSEQGPGTSGFDANFNFATNDYPSYPHQSSFTFPNLNFALFGENIFMLSEKFSLTPGFRLEYINTQSEGQYTEVRYNNAGDEIFRKDTTDNRTLDRAFALLGLGASYRHSGNLELYGNISQNYRSVTFSDIRVVSPTFIIDPNIKDESGFTSDIGMRGKWKNYLSYDVGAYAVMYKDRIGTILESSGPNKGDRVRQNIGNALTFGVEAFAEWNVVETFGLDASRFKLSPFMNLALTDSEYLQSEENNVAGKKVEFIPAINLKTGLRFGYKNLMGNLQYTYLSEQFTDAENTPVPPKGDSREGIIGEIPAYSIMDFSLSYRVKKVKIETGVNNLLDEKYFTRRATGYPGPGIIPSSPRAYYLTLEFKI
ncbi:TonB-dependent receptor [Flammeovirgaceae bacterium SG7u.111]|nr:TonB-dependent receptor [Flammeovirgaceae bacterium SG7u.132]WPO35058.1 TonB-dependent receptor [Flammeovirgaceae bacterium SG7u.111]